MTSGTTTPPIDQMRRFDRNLLEADRRREGIALARRRGTPKTAHRCLHTEALGRPETSASAGKPYARR